MANIPLLSDLVSTTNDGISNMIEAVKGTINYASGAAAIKANAVANGSVNGETPITMEVKELGNLQAQQNTSKVLASLGINVDGTADIRRQAAESYKKSIIEQSAADDEVVRRNSSSLFTDPLQWIQDQLMLPLAERKAESLAKATTNKKNALDSLNKMVSDTAVATNAAAEVRSAASVQSKVAAVKNEIDAQAQSVNLENAKLNLQGLEAVGNAEQRRLSNNFSLASQENADAQLKLAQEHAAAVRKQNELELRRLSMLIEDREEAKADNEIKLQHYNLAQAARGMAPINMQEFKQMFSNPKTKDGVIDDLTTGMLISQTGKTSLVAETPGLSAYVLNSNKTNLPAGKKEIVDFIGGIATDTLTNKKYVKLDSTGTPISANALDLSDKSTRKQNHITMINESVAAKVKEYMSNPGNDSKENIYSITNQPISAMLTTIPTAADTTFFKKIVAPQVAGGMDKLNFDRLLSDGLAGIKAGKVNVEDVAQGIADLGAVAMATNNIVRDYNAFGLPSQKNAKVKVSVPGVLFDSKEQMSVNNVNDVRRVLAKVLAAQVKKESIALPAKQNPFYFGVD